MFQKIKPFFQSLVIFFKNRPSRLRVLRQGRAMRILFFYPGEEGTYVDQPDIKLYENGIVEISSHQEESTTHLKNCEILWKFEMDTEDPSHKVRLLKPKTEKPLEKKLDKKKSETP